MKHSNRASSRLSIAFGAVCIVFALAFAALHSLATTSFPKIHHPELVRMSLSRSGCMGACPIYSVQVQGDGTVLYSGAMFVAVTGKHIDQISKGEVTQLIEMFRKADYWSLEYERANEHFMDVPRYEISLEIDSKEKRAEHWAPSVSGDKGKLHLSWTTDQETLKRLRDLEDEIDRVADSDRWTKGNSQTVRSLQEEHFNFRSSEGAKMLARVAMYGTADAVRDLIAAGAPLNGRDELNGAATLLGRMAGATAVERAAYRGDVEMLRLLLDAGVARNDPKLIDECIAKAVNGRKTKAEQFLRDYARESGASAAPKEAAPVATTTQAEIVLWKSIENSTNPADFKSYLVQYPQGAFAVLAKRHLVDIERPGGLASVDLSGTANAPLDWLADPPHGSVVLGSIRYRILYGPRAVVKTSSLYDATRGNSATIPIPANKGRGVQKVHMLLSGVWVQLASDRMVGSVRLNYEDGSQRKISLVTHQTIRETWEYNDQVFGAQSLESQSGIEWKEVWREPQGRCPRQGSKRCDAAGFLDSLSIVSDSKRLLMNVMIANNDSSGAGIELAALTLDYGHEDFGVAVPASAAPQVSARQTSTLISAFRQGPCHYRWLLGPPRLSLTSGGASASAAVIALAWVLFSKGFYLGEEFYSQQSFLKLPNGRIQPGPHTMSKIEGASTS